MDNIFQDHCIIVVGNNKDLNIDFYDNENEDYFDCYNIAFVVEIDNYLCIHWEKDIADIKSDSLVDNAKNSVLFFINHNSFAHNNCFSIIYHNILSL
jgi:hypothetical protein